jgi:hypothetical protein
VDSAEHPVQIEFLTRDDALELLKSKEAWKRDVAQTWLEKHKDTAGDAIVEQLRAEGRKRKKKQRILLWAVGLYCAALIGILGIWLLKGLTTGKWSEFPWQLFQAFTWIGILGSAGLASQFQKNATQVIAKLNDKRYIPDLVDALSYKDDEVTGAVLGALKSLLPTLTASDAELLSTDHRKALYGYLTPPVKDAALTRAILKALEQVGDERDLAPIRKLAERTPVNSRESETVQAAIECLPFVEQRAKSNRAASTLLRASASTPDSNLLRPSGENRESDTDILLRPTDSAQPSPIVFPADSEVPDSAQIQYPSS